MALHERFIHTYAHHGRIGVMLELALQSPLDDVSDEHRQRIRDLAQDLVLQIAACAPQSVAELLEQSWVREPSTTIGELIDTTTQRLREPILVTRMMRWDDGNAAAPADQPDGPPKVRRLNSSAA